jgi:diguanylate cyclase (GGDEF)-like protein
MRTPILVIDDDDAMRRLLDARLRRAGFDVFQASDGVRGLQILLQEGINLVITDWMMPEMNGLEFCEAVRNTDHIGFTYIIMLTANTDKKSVITAFESGADDVLAKPFHEGELLARLKAGQRILELESDLASNVLMLHKTNAEMAVLNGKLDTMATTDELTGLTNRREALHRLDEEYVNAARHGGMLSCIAFDIDHFKSFNDNHGHDVGDVVLRETAKAMHAVVRSGERLCRIGGEEFLVVCRSTDSSGAMIAGERFRAQVEKHLIRHNKLELKVTISVGVASLRDTDSGVDTLLKRADDALYAAKRRGRNCVCVSDVAIPSTQS